MNAKSDDVSGKVRPKSFMGKCVMCFVHMIAGIVLLVILAVGGLFVRLQSGPLAFPLAQEIVEHVANNALSGFDVRVGNVSLVAAKQGFPAEVQLSDMRVFSPNGQNLVQLPIVRAKIDPVSSIIHGITVSTVEVVGAEIRVLRDLNGKYNFLPPGEQDVNVVTPDDIFEIVNKAAMNSPLRGLKLINMVDTRFIYVDQVRSRVWRTSKTLMQSRRVDDVITANADVVFKSKGRKETSAGLRFSYAIKDNTFDFGFKFDHASTVDLADQVAALDWLRNFDAAVTGSLKAQISTSGALVDLSGFLETEEGKLLGIPQSKPVKFESGKAYFDYDKVTDTLDFSQISVNSGLGRVTAESKISMSRNGSGVVNALSGAVTVSKLEVHPSDIFANPVVFDKGKVNLHLTLSPFAISVENGILAVGPQNITVAGSSIAGEKYWDNAYFLKFNAIKRDNLLNYWPLSLKPKTRRWMEKNILGGVVKNGVGQLYSHNGKTSIDLKFDVEDGKVRYLKTLPVLEGAVGKGHLTEKTFDVTLSKGHVIAPNNGRVDVVGSVFSISDLTQKPTIGDIVLKATGGLRAGLSLLDEKPFEYLKKVNLKPTVAKGRVEVDAILKVPLVKGTKVKDIKFNAKATIKKLTDVLLIKGRDVIAEQMQLTADNNSLNLSGTVELDGLQTETTWEMPIGKGYKGGSDLVSEFIINEENMRDFGIIFDEGIITGSSPGQMKVKLHPGQAPSYTLTSDMVGLGLNVTGLNWSKPEKTNGKLIVKGTLGDKLTVDSLLLNAAGLSAKGSVNLGKNGKFLHSDLTSLIVGKWLNASVTIVGLGQGKTSIFVNDGTVDLRKIGPSNGSKSGPPLDIYLDRLVLADGIILTDVTAKLSRAKGLRGPFSAKVNGGAQITGAIFPQNNGTAAEVFATDAGSVLRSSNLYGKASGGDLRMVLIPSGKDGHYNGTFQIKRTKVKQDGVLADLLNAISVVGLVQELAGEGIVFELVDGQFELKPEGVVLHNTSAVGVSIGLTLEGNYNSTTKKVNFEGVITPLYAINGTLERVFGKIFGRRKGEGVFSFVYRVKGLSSAPKITVNPLSVLAPGVIREVFRKKIPEVGKATISPSVGNTKKQIDPEFEGPDK